MQFCHRVLPYHSGVHRQPHGLGLESTNGYIGFTLEYRESIGEEVTGGWVGGKEQMMDVER